MPRGRPRKTLQDAAGEGDAAAKAAERGPNKQQPSPPPLEDEDSLMEHLYGCAACGFAEVRAKEEECSARVHAAAWLARHLALLCSKRLLCSLAEFDADLERGSML
jgi:hypothetical protein